MQMTYTKYKCTQCDAEDTDKTFPGEAILPAIDCWKCHAGQSKTIAEMFARRAGMFPVVAEA